MCLLDFSMSGVIPKTPTTVFSVMLTTRSVHVTYTHVQVYVRIRISPVCIHACTYVPRYVCTLGVTETLLYHSVRT